MSTRHGQSNSGPVQTRDVAEEVLGLGLLRMCLLFGTFWP